MTAHLHSMFLDTIFGRWNWWRINAGLLCLSGLYFVVSAWSRHAFLPAVVFGGANFAAAYFFTRKNRVVFSMVGIIILVESVLRMVMLIQEPNPLLLLGFVPFFCLVVLGWQILQERVKPTFRS